MAKRMFEKSCQCQVHRTWYRLHASSPEAEVSTYSTEFDGSQDFSNTLLEAGSDKECQEANRRLDAAIAKAQEFRHKFFQQYSPC